MEEVICEECGGVMVPHQDATTTGMICPNCSWGWIRTYMPEIVRDETLYGIKVSGGDPGNRAQIRAVAQVAKVNFLAARQILVDSSPDLCQGRAVEVADAIRRLKAAGLEVLVTPEFPHDLSE